MITLFHCYVCRLPEFRERLWKVTFRKCPVGSREWRKKFERKLYRLFHGVTIRKQGRDNEIAEKSKASFRYHREKII